MSENNEFRVARTLLVAVVDGTRVDPNAIAVSERFGESVPGAQLVLRIPKLFILHELGEADIEVEPSSLASFVLEDIKQSAGTAATTYLTIAQRANPDAAIRDHWWRRARRPATRLTQEWRTADEVRDDGEVIEIIGTVVPWVDVR